MTTLTEKRPFYKLHADDDFIDEVRIIVRERYKTSGLSGDEWRFHRVIQLFRKGILLHEEPFNGHIDKVAGFVPLVIAQWGDNGVTTEQRAEHLCFQPGCRESATSEYELIEEFGPHGERLHPEENSYHSARRRFCQKHLRRGDCGREDADRNYRVISGYGPDGADMSEANVVKAARVDVQVGSVDEIPDAIAEAMRNREAERDPNA